MKPTIAFVLGTRRSGSHWLGEVLGSHSWAAPLGEFMKHMTIPGHVACRLCQADGRAGCSLYDGIVDVAPDDLHLFAAARLQRPVLIDISKRYEWAQRFTARTDLDVRLIHLVRDSRGYIESEGRRRTDADGDMLLEEWVAWNREIDAFLATTDRPRILVSYEELADTPARAFPPLCAFLGHAFEPQALEYWNTPKHALGANGAASLYLRGRAVEVARTGDDEHYAQLTQRPTAADRRWAARLPAEIAARAAAHPYVREMAARFAHA
jgi:hypothetical protein